MTPSFFVGFLINFGDGHTGGFQMPAAVDLSNPLANRSFMNVGFGGTGDIYHLNSSTLFSLDTLEYYGPQGNFLIRANPCAPVPEPSSAALALIGCAGFLALRGTRNPRPRV